MTNREKILSAIGRNQPEFTDLPPEFIEKRSETESLQLFIQVLSEIGAEVFEVSEITDLQANISRLFPGVLRKVTTLNILSDIAEVCDTSGDPHTFENVDVAILEGHFGVAENGAIWITEDKMGLRVLPFICQHLVLILPKSRVISSMHEAYVEIGNADYNFGTFIAGPSKTADIEQSLVLGAHGPKSLMVLLLS